MHARQPADRLAWHLQGPALSAGSDTERIGLLKAGKVAAVNVNTSPKTANLYIAPIAKNNEQTPRRRSRL